MNSIKIQSDFVRNLDQSIKDALISYTGSESRLLNKSLREGASLRNKDKELLDKIDYAFSQVPAVTSPITVYRGINSNTFIPDILAYVSTSLKQSVAMEATGNKCCLLEILIVPGSKILPLQSISRYEVEDEILLPRNGRFEITNKYIKNSSLLTYNLTYLPEFSIEVTYITTISDASDAMNTAKLVDKLTEDIYQLLEEFPNLTTNEALDELLGTDEYNDNVLINNDVLNAIKSRINK